jgi:hypothetical protein
MRFAPLAVSDQQQLSMSSRASAGCWFIDLSGIFWSSQSSKYLITDQLPPQTAFAARIYQHWPARAFKELADYCSMVIFL